MAAPVPITIGSSQQSASAVQVNHSVALSDTDPIAKYQTLLPILSESVTNLIREAVFILQNTAGGLCKQTDIQGLNKSIEDFYNISDQVQQWLVLADSTIRQNLLGIEFSTPVTTSITTQSDSTGFAQEQSILFYSHYLENAKRQVLAAKRLDDMLAAFADGLGARS